MGKVCLSAARWRLRITRLFFILSCIFATSALAHKVNVFAYLEGDRVYVQGYFLDGKKAKNSKVTVYDSGDKPVVEGLTNEEGEFTFPLPAKQDIRIVLNAGEGHQAEYRFTAAEIAGVLSDAVPQQSGNIAAANAAAPETSPSETSALAPTNAELRRAVAEGVMPLAREISELKERRSLSDILGGIGFIVGVLGAFAYFQARKRR